MNILFVADIHIKLGQKNVPKQWQLNRLDLLSKKLTSLYIAENCDILMIGGDLLDSSDPSYEEVASMLHFLKSLGETCKVMVYSGNHEAVSKRVSCLTPFEGLLDNVKIVGSYRSKEFDIIDYPDLHKKSWDKAESRLCFTHVRGEIPPHVKPEIDLTRFAKHGYEKVLAGDLHSRKNSQGIIEYPGSPFTTSFHRNLTKGSNGAIVVDTDTLETKWFELGLPQLLRISIGVGEDKPAQDSEHRVIYEVIGTVDELASVNIEDENFDKVVVKTSAKEVEKLEGETLTEEVIYYAKEKMGVNKDKVIAEIPNTIVALRNRDD